jgi:hypothetical protein
MFTPTIPDERLEYGFLTCGQGAPSFAISGRKPQGTLAVVNDKAIIQKVSAIRFHVICGLLLLPTMIDQVIHARPVFFPFERYNVSTDVAYLFLVQTVCTTTPDLRLSVLPPKVGNPRTVGRPLRLRVDGHAAYLPECSHLQNEIPTIPYSPFPTTGYRRNKPRKPVSMSLEVGLPNLECNELPIRRQAQVCRISSDLS